MTRLETQPSNATPTADPRAAAEHEQLHAWDAAHYWHSFTPMADYEPLVIERAEGSTLYDVRGNAYLDGASSMWCAGLGHGHPRVTAAIAEQLGKLAHCTSLGMGADVAVRLAKRLADLAPGDLRHVFFSSDGSSAIEIAMKQAVQFQRQREEPKPEKTKFVCFENAYHGDTIGATAVGGIGRYYEVFGPLLCEVIRVASPTTAGPFDAPENEKANPPRALSVSAGGTRPKDIDRATTPGANAYGSQKTESDHACSAALARVRDVFAEHADTIAAVVIEPLVQCAAGMRMHPPGFLAGLRRLCDEHDVLLIADEVAVGFGRTGRLFACDHEAVTPDFLCVGKHLTAGYLPMAATLTTPRVYEAFLNRHADEDRTFWHGHTFSGNALAAAAALATLDELEEHVLPALPDRIAQLGERWCDLAAHPAVRDARQRGMIAAFNLDPGGGFLDEASLGRRMARHAMERGVWLRAKPDLVYLMPPLNVSPADLDRMCDIVAECLEVGTADERR